MEGGSNAHGTAAAAAAAPATGLRKVVWIRQMLRRWQSTARTSNGSATGELNANAHQQNEDAAKASKLPLVVPAPEKEEEHGDGEPTTPGAPASVPRGCCAVYVGAERRRFVVPTAYLSNPVFRRLLEKAEEEFEFEYVAGALTIPCDTESFKYILAVMERHRKGLVVVDHGTYARAAFHTHLGRAGVRTTPRDAWPVVGFSPGEPANELSFLLIFGSVQKGMPRRPRRRQQVDHHHHQRRVIRNELGRDVTGPEQRPHALLDSTSSMMVGVPFEEIIHQRLNPIRGILSFCSIL